MIVNINDRGVSISKYIVYLPEEARSQKTTGLFYLTEKRNLKQIKTLQKTGHVAGWPPLLEEAGRRLRKVYDGIFNGSIDNSFYYKSNYQCFK